MKKKIFFGLAIGGICLVCIVLFATKDIDEKSRIIATVNGETIYQEDYERIKALNSSLKNEKIIELIMKEVIVYQEAEKIGVYVHDEDVENRIKHLKNELPDMYKLCIEQYGTDNKYKEALKYTMLYQAVYDYYATKYIENLNYDIKEIEAEFRENNLLKDEEFDINSEDILSYLKSKYKDEIADYFFDWNCNAYDKANKKYL